MPSVIDPILALAIVALVFNALGCAISTYLVFQAGWDALAVKILRVDTYRGAVARHSLLSESVRLILQLILFWRAVPSLFLAPERYSSAVNDLWPLVVLGSASTLVMSVLLLWNSAEGLRLRAYVLSGIITDPDPDDVANLTPTETIAHFRSRNVRRIE